MSRTELLDVLEITQCALETKDFMPLFKCLVFTEGKVQACNGQFLIEASVDVPGLKGAIPGKVFINFLASVSSRMVEVKECSSSSVRIKAGSSQIQLPVMEEGQFPLMSIQEEKVRFPMTKDVMDGLSKCLVSAANNTVLGSLTGVILECQEGRVTFSSTDDRSISGAVVEVETGPVPQPFHIGISQTLASVLLKMYERTRDFSTVTVGEKGIELVVDGAYRLVGMAHSIDQESVERLREVVSLHVNGVYTRGMTHLPSSLASALDRADMMVDDNSNLPYTVIEVDEQGNLHLSTETQVGMVRDVIKKVEVPPIKRMVSARLLRRALGYGTRIGISDTCVLLENETQSYHYLVAVEDVK